MATSIKRGDPQSEKIKYIKGTFFVIRPDETSKEPFWIAYALEDVPAKNKEVYVRWLTVSDEDETEYKVGPESSSSNIPIESIIVTTTLKANSKQESSYRISKIELRRVITIVENESSSEEEEEEEESNGEEEKEGSGSESEESESESEVPAKKTKKQLVDEQKKAIAAGKKVQKEKEKEKEKEKAKKLKEKEKEKAKAKKQKEKEKEKAKKLKEKEKEKEKEKKRKIKEKSKKSTKQEDTENDSESESESESSSSESEKEESSKKSSSKKKTTTKEKSKPTKKSKKQETEDEEESASDESSDEDEKSSSDEDEGEKKSSSSSKKSSSAANGTPQEIKPIVKKSTGKRKKNEDSDASSGDEEEEEEDKTTTKKSKGKGGESKKVVKEKVTKVAKPTKASIKAQTKKGNPNPAITVLEVDPGFEWAKTATTLSGFCCSICRSREASKAIIENNIPLLKEIIKENRFNSLLSNWSSGLEKSPLHYAIINNNLEAIELIYKDAKDETKLRPSLPNFDKASTGTYSKYTYGHNVRALTQSRGGKEGDEAFLHDSNNYQEHELTLEVQQTNIIQLIFSNSCVKMTTIQELFKLDPTLNDNVSYNIYYAVRAGNLEVSEHFVKDLFKRGGFGFNNLHSQALSVDGNEEFLPFKSVSVTKKPNFGNVTPIHFAAINPKGKYLKQLLDVLSEPSRPDHNSFRPLHYAAACTSPVNVQLLTSKGVELNDLNSLGMTPLMIASQLGRVQNIKALVKASKERQIVNFVKFKNKKLQDALHFAAEAGQLGSIRTLLEEGADIDVFEKGTKYTALMKASIMGHFDAVKILVEEGKADVEKKDKFKRTALVLAAINGHIKIVSFLLHYNASFKVIDSSKNSILHFTAAYGWIDIIRYLVEQFQAPINEFNDWKTTPLSVAIRKGHFQCTKYLLDKDADANVTDENNRSILLQSLVNSSLSMALMENIKYLIVQGKANVNHQDKDLNGVLHVLSLAEIELPGEVKTKQPAYYWGGQPKPVEDPVKAEKRLQDQLKIVQEIANYLISKGATVNSKNKDGCTPLMLAFQEKNIPIIIYLLGRSDVSLVGTYSSTKSNILHEIMKLDDSLHFSKITDLLLKSKDLKTIINQYNKEHLTPLMSIIKNFKSGTTEKNEKFFKFLRSLISNAKPDLSLVEEKLVIDADSMDESDDHHNTSNISHNSDDDNSDNGSDDDDDDDDDDNDSDDDNNDDNNSDNEDHDQKKEDKELILKRSVLHFAVQTGSLNIVQILLEFKPKDIDQLNVYSETALHNAIDGNHFQIASLLVDSGANVKISNSFERSPLHLACAKMNFPLIKKLASKGSPINKQDFKGLTPLMIACQNKGNISDEALEGEDNPISILLQNGADPKIVDSKKRNALHYSINASGADTNSSFEIEDLLIKHKAPLNEVDYLGRTPLHYAFIKIGSRFIDNGTSYDPVQVVSSLCSFETIQIDKPDKFGRSPLFYACQHGSTVSALLLIQRKADINRVDEDGNTPLAITLLFKHPDCAINVIQKGANVKGTLTRFNYKITKTETPWKTETTTTTPSTTTPNGATTTTTTTTVSASTTASTNIHPTAPSVAAIPFNRGRIGRAQHSNASTQEPAIPHYKQPMKIEYKVEKINVCKVGLFYHVVSNNWQGVAYIMLDSGLDNFSALHDAFKADKYQLALTLLSKCRSAAELSPLSPESKQNLFHFIGMYPSSVANWSARVQQKLLSSGVSPNLTDSTGRTPLHYAAVSENVPFTQFLLTQKLNINQQDKEGNTPLSLALIKIKTPTPITTGTTQQQSTEDIIKNFVLPAEFKLLLTNLPNLELKFKYEENEITPLIYAINIKNIGLIGTLLNSKANINTVDALGQPPLFHAVKTNKMDIVNLLLSKKPNMNIQDTDKKSVIHYVVNPTEYGSFENVTLLNLLSKQGSKIDLADIAGKTPLYYASLQDSGKMRDALIKLGAKKIPQETLPTREVSTISNWSELNTVNYEQDYNKYIETKKELMAASNKQLKPLVDPISRMQENSDVYVDSNGLIFDILMTKVDAKRGNWGENNFYKMQIIYNPGLDRYFLWNRWGRIGDIGQYQKTPFSKDEAVTEFCKIFKTKSGNAFNLDSMSNFQKIEGRYHLVHIDRTDKTKKEILHPFVLSQYPKSQLPKELYDVMAQFCNVESISHQLKNLKIDTDIMPLGRISKDLIQKAIGVLGKLSEAVEQIRLIEEYETNKRASSFTTNVGSGVSGSGGDSTSTAEKPEEPNFPPLNDVKESLIKLSNEFYELIPHSNFSTERMVILKNAKEITAKTTLLQNLDELETVSKILIAAHQNTTMHPYDYCFKALGASLEKLDANSPEFGILKKYSENTGCTNKIVNIFKLQRKGEVERFQAHKNLKNHFLLWHGSLTTNYLSILSQGLKIAPPEAPVTGYMFGKGIYFSDMFRKSINYCGGWNGPSTNSFLLLSEVALGTMKEFKSAHYMESPETGTNSTKGVGKTGPNFDDSIILNNGVAIPLSPPEQVKGDTSDYHLEMNEYIVYDVSQIRMRYLVEVSNN
ncbi:hypothetical protein ACTFIZ_006024 [Dictyostelium cf. discoideum]